MSYIDYELTDAVIVAAGIGSRMGADRPKQYLMLGEQTILEHTVHALLKVPCIAQVILVLHPDDPFFAHTSLAHNPKIKTTIGGKERVDSVLNGLHLVKSKWCLVHDAARPFVSEQDITNLVNQVLATPQVVGGILAHKAADTLKLECKQQADKASAIIERTIDRSLVWHAMTPQMFKTQELISAIEQALDHNKVITDEASALELQGKEVLLVDGSSLNFKITTPTDLVLAQALLSHLP